MSVYIVSWGLCKDDQTMEIDSIMHPSREEAQEEFDLVDLGQVASGPYAQGLAAGWVPYCSLYETDMLDEAEAPTDDPAKWVFDTDHVLIAERRA